MCSQRRRSLVVIPSHQLIGPLLDRCQVLAGAARLEPDATLDALERLTLDIPREISELGRVVVTGALVHLLARLALHVRIAREPDIALGFVDLLRCRRLPVWQRRFAHLLRCCRSALTRQKQAGLPDDSAAARVRRVLEMIDARYGDPRLTIADAALVACRSVAHLSRLLKRDTGESFGVLLRRCRIRVAKDLLLGSSASMTEVAVATGFGSASRFSREFKREVGTTPTEFRESAGRY